MQTSSGNRDMGIEVMGPNPWGTHFCLFYRTAEDLADILVPYFRAGLESNECCMWVTADPLNADAARAGLARAVPDLDRRLAEGQIEILDYRQWYLRGGRFDAEAVLRGWAERTEQALARGFDGLRITGNTFWLEAQDWPAFSAYERAVNEVIGRLRMIALCTYSLDRCDASQALDVVAEHRFALARREGVWERLESAELGRTELRLRQLSRAVAQSPASIVITDAAGKIEYVNHRFEQVTGYSAEEVLGQNPRLLKSGQTSKEEYQRMWSTITAGGEWHGEFHNRKRNGELYWERAIISPVIDPDGVVRSYLAVKEDITERKRAEQAQQFLTEATAVLAASIDHETTLGLLAQLAVPTLADWCFVDLLEGDDRLRRVKVAHCDPEQEALARDLIGSPPGLGPDSAGMQALRSGKSLLVPQVTPHVSMGISMEQCGVTPHVSMGISMEQCGVTPDLMAAVAQDSVHDRLLRALNPHSMMIVPLLARGRALGVLFFLTTGTQRCYGPEDLALAEELARRAGLAIDNAQLYRQAQEAVRARERFLTTASHELRTPLTVLRGYAEALTHTIERALAGDSGATTVTMDRARVTRAAERVMASVERLTGLVEELLDLSRLLRGGIGLAPESMDLAELLAKVTDETCLRLGREGKDAWAIELRADGAIRGQWDSARMEQVLVNLLENAIKYSPSGGRVTVAAGVEDGDAAQPGKRAHLLVKDQGVGIPPGEQQRVFGMFARASNVSDGRYSGLGVGLAIAREIVERHGGRIWVESEGVGKGSAFHVVLPGAEAA